MLIDSWSLPTSTWCVYPIAHVCTAALGLCLCAESFLLPPDQTVERRGQQPREHVGSLGKIRAEAGSALCGWGILARQVASEECLSWLPSKLVLIYHYSDQSSLSQLVASGGRETNRKYTSKGQHSISFS